MSYVPFTLDASTTALIQIDEEQHWVHVGQHFLSNFSTAFPAAGGTANVTIGAPNNSQKVHALFDYNSTTDTTFSIIENPTINVTGASASAYNRERNYTNTASSLVRTMASAQGGVVIYSERIGMTGSNTFASTPGKSRGNAEFVLKSGTTYEFLASSLTGGYISLDLDFYEL